MMLRYLAVAGMSLAVAACSIGRPIPTATTYNIELTPDTSAPVKTPRPERLRVARVRVAAPYDGVDLVYRTSEVRYVSDPYHAFLAEPGPMLSSRISEWLNGTGLFQSVDGPGGATPPNWVLEATVLELYGDFQELRGAPAAVMTVRFSVIDEGSPRPKVIYDRSVSERVSVPTSSPDALVIGYGAALSAALKQFTSDISQLRPQ